jgi:hypothetical protein
MKTLLAAVFGSVCLLSVSSAKADITFCNNYSSQIWVAVGWPYLGGAMDCQDRFGADEMMGWYSMMPGNCTTVFYGCDSAGWLHFNATAADGAYWGGDDDWGRLSYSAFDFCYNTTACYDDQCPSFDYGPVGFLFVHVDNGCGFLGLEGFEKTIDLN